MSKKEKSIKEEANTTQEENKRWFILDLVEAIANEITFLSHCNENITGLVQLWTEIDDKDKEDLDDLYYLRDQSLDNRRYLMTMLKDNVKWNMKYWCMLKHAIASWAFITEVEQADFTYHTALIRETEKMAMVLSKFTGIAMTNCLRCFNDAMFTK